MTRKFKLIYKLNNDASKYYNLSLDASDEKGAKKIGDKKMQKLMNKNPLKITNFELSEIMEDN